MIWDWPLCQGFLEAWFLWGPGSGASLAKLGLYVQGNSRDSSLSVRCAAGNWGEPRKSRARDSLTRPLVLQHSGHVPGEHHSACVTHMTLSLVNGRGGGDARFCVSGSLAML